MKVLITGATGLVGNDLVRVCHQRGICVNYLTTKKSKIVSKTDYRGFYWNPDENEIDLDCFVGVSAIINLAGAAISKRWTTKYKKKILTSRINSLRTLNFALEKVDTDTISSFVSASAIGIYPSSLEEYYTEDEKKVETGFLGAIVKAWEAETDALEKFDFRVAKVRIGLVLSDKGGALPEMTKPIKYGLGAAFGNGKQWQSWIHITDLASMFLHIIEQNLHGTYNGVGPNPVTNAKLVNEIGKVLRRPIFLPNIPEIIMKFLLGEMAFLLFASQRVSSKKIEEEGFVFQFQNIGVALEAIYDKKYFKEL